MATLADNGLPTLLNVLKTLRPDGSVETDIAEVMTLKRAILEDIPWYPTNLDTADLVTTRTGLPSPKWRDYNQGIDPSKPDTSQFTETCGMIEDRSEVDVKLAERTGSAGAFRMAQDKVFLEGFSQLLETAFFYENAINSPSRLHGLAARYPATTGYTSSGYVLKGTNSGTNCQSVWLIEFGEDAVSGIYPKNSIAGLKQEDLGKRLITGANAKQMLAYVTQFNWDAGVRVKDYRKTVRYQWDPDDPGFAPTAKGMYLALNQMLTTVYDLDSTKARFYMNRASFQMLFGQLMSNSINMLDWVTEGARRVPTFAGIPIRVTDSLIAESAIS